MQIRFLVPQRVACELLEHTPTIPNIHIFGHKLQHIDFQLIHFVICSFIIYYYIYIFWIE